MLYFLYFYFTIIGRTIIRWAQVEREKALPETSPLYRFLSTPFMPDY
jgi:hypothetical protein